MQFSCAFFHYLFFLDVECHAILFFRRATPSSHQLVESYRALRFLFHEGIGRSRRMEVFSLHPTNGIRNQECMVNSD